MGSKIAGGTLLLAGGVLFAQAISTGVRQGVLLGGPTLAPIIVTGIWVVVALIYFLGQLRPAPPSPAGSPASPSGLAAVAPPSPRGPAAVALAETGPASPAGSETGTATVVSQAGLAPEETGPIAASQAGSASSDTGMATVVSRAELAPEAMAQARSDAADAGSASAEQAVPFRWRTPFLVLAALVVYAVVLKYTMIGYVLATAIFFVFTARLLSTRPLREVIVRDISVAIGLSLAIYLAFTKLLGIVLPAGVLPL